MCCLFKVRACMREEHMELRKGIWWAPRNRECEHCGCLNSVAHAGPFDKLQAKRKYSPSSLKISWPGIWSRSPFPHYLSHIFFEKLQGFLSVLEKLRFSVDGRCNRKNSSGVIGTGPSCLHASVWSHIILSSRQEENTVLDKCLVNLQKYRNILVNPQLFGCEKNWLLIQILSFPVVGKRQCVFFSAFR